LNSTRSLASTTTPRNTRHIISSKRSQTTAEALPLSLRGSPEAKKYNNTCGFTFTTGRTNIEIPCSRFEDPHPYLLAAPYCPTPGPEIVGVFGVGRKPSNSRRLVYGRLRSQEPSPSKIQHEQQHMDATSVCPPASRSGGAFYKVPSSHPPQPNCTA